MSDRTRTLARPVNGLHSLGHDSAATGSALPRPPVCHASRTGRAGQWGLLRAHHRASPAPRPTCRAAGPARRLGNDQRDTTAGRRRTAKQGSRAAACPPRTRPRQCRERDARGGGRVNADLWLASTCCSRWWPPPSPNVRLDASHQHKRARGRPPAPPPTTHHPPYRRACVPPLLFVFYFFWQCQTV